MNKIILIGRAGKDPEVRTLEGGTKVANFSLATSKHFTKNGEKQIVTTWHNIVCWLKLADLAESYIHKGDQVALEGELQVREWTDKDSNKRQSYEIHCSTIELLGAKKGEDRPAEPPASTYERTGRLDKEQIQDNTPVDESDLPF